MNNKEVATKQDIADLRIELVGKIENVECRMEGKLDALEVKIDGKLDGLEKRIDDKFEAFENRIDAKLNTFKDEIIRAFQMTEENIRQDAAHPDEVVALEQRVTAIEKHVGILST